MLKKLTSILIISASLLTAISGKVFAGGVEYRGRPDGLVVLGGSDFFEDFGTLVPGDVKEWKIDIKNTSINEAELFFKINIPEQTEQTIKTELAQKIRIKLVQDYKGNTTEMYNGTISNLDQMENFVSVGKYAPNTDGAIQCTLTVPTEVDNSYSGINLEASWEFSVIDKEENSANPDDGGNGEGGNGSGSQGGNGENGSGSGNQGGNGENGSGSGSQGGNGENGSGSSSANGQNANAGKGNNGRTTSPQTGDKVMMVVGVLIISIAMLVIIGVKVRKKDGDKNSKVK